MRHTQRYSASILLFTLHFLLGPAHAQKVTTALGQLSKYEGLKKASWGFACQNVKTGKMLASKNAHLTLTPASTFKTLTTGAALATLGGAFKARTQLVAQGPITNGVLEGNLYLLGEGDPTLGSDRFKGASQADSMLAHWVRAVQAAGITKVQGQVVGVGISFSGPAQAPGWQWADVANYFGAGISGLNWRENIFTITFRTGARGSMAKITGTEGAPAGMVFKSKVTAYGSTDQAYIYMGTQANQRLVIGSLPPGRDAFTIKAALPDPALACATDLSAALKQAGIATTGADAVDDFSIEKDMQSLVQAREQGKVLHTHFSPPLSELVAQTNIHSLNLYAETLARWVGYKQKQEASTEAANEALAAYWTGMGIEPEGLIINDGSGLSPTNGISPLQLMSIVSKAGRHPTEGANFRNSLAVLGRTGTLADIGRGTPAAGKVLAKSGTLTRVICYTGFATLASGEEVVFALLVNRFSGAFSPMKKQIEQLLVALPACKE